MKWFHLFIFIGFLALIASAADDKKTDAIQPAVTDAAKTDSVNPDKAREDRAAKRRRRKVSSLSMHLNLFIMTYFSTEDADANTANIASITSADRMDKYLMINLIGCKDFE
jgi:hypothetical protein